MLKQLFLITFSVLSWGSLVFTCGANHNLYVASSQTTANIDCVITPTENEQLSNNQNTSFLIILIGIDPPASNSLQAITVDGTTTQVYYHSFTNVLESLYFNFPGPLDLSAGTSHHVIFPINLTSKSVTVTTELQVKLRTNSETISLIQATSTFEIYAASSISQDCQYRHLQLVLNLARNTSKKSGIKITLPPYMSLPSYSKGPCTIFEAGTNVVSSVQCESNGTTLLLYNAVSSNLFTNNSPYLIFNLTKISCNSIGSDGSIKISIFNVFNRVTIVGETLITPLAAASVSPLECPLGSYLNGGSCASCISNCDQCSQPNQCSECSTGFSLYLSQTCGSVCPKGYYSSSKVCVQCNNKCSECSSQTSCTGCVDTYFLYNFNCSGSCPTKTFQDANAHECRNCLSRCATCTDATSCAVCEPGYFFNGTHCNSCGSNCGLCESETNCSQCSNSATLIDNGAIKFCLKCQDNEFISTQTCVQCSTGCSRCTSLNYCSQCTDSTQYEPISGVCTCKASYCKSNCPISEAGCSICSGTYFYNDHNNKCSVCSLSTIRRTTHSLKYNICTGILTDTNDSTSFYGYSGSGTSKNDVCSITNSISGPIPPGSYNISNILCKVNGRGSKRVLSLTPINKFSDESTYSSLFESLSIYDEVSEAANYDYSEGTNGIVMNDNMRSLYTVGDLLTVTLDGCDSQIESCLQYPPPSIGTTTVTSTGVNEFKINFANWGGSVQMDLTKFRYSATITLHGSQIELCSDLSTITNEGLLCNAGNSKKLGYFSAGGSYALTLKAKYAFVSTKQGIWSSSTSTIDIVNVTSTENASEAVLKPINFTSVSDLQNDMYYRKQAIGTLITAPVIVPKATVCPSSYCKNGGTCSIIGQKPRCRCASGFSGTSCDITSEIQTMIIRQNDQASANLLELMPNVILNGDSKTIVDIVASITSNTEVVSPTAISNSITALKAAGSLASFASIDSSTIRSIAGNIISALIKSVIRTKQTRRMLADTATINNAETTDNLNSVFSVVKDIVKKDAASIAGSTDPTIIDAEGEMSIYYFPAALENITIDNVFATIDSNYIAQETVYPKEISELFPIPDNYSLKSNVFAIYLIDDASPFGSNTAPKTIIFKADEGARRLEDLSVSCGYYDTTSKAFSEDSCTTLVLESGDIQCACSTSEENFYVVMQNAVAAKSKLKMILMISIPIGCGVLIILSIIFSCCCNKKNDKNGSVVSYKATDVKSIALSEIKY